MFDGYDMHTLLLVVVSFFCGVAIILSYKAVKFFKHNNSSLKNAIVDNRIKQYADKLQVYDKAIADLQFKVDMLEMSKRTNLISRDIDNKKDISERDIKLVLFDISNMSTLNWRSAIALSYACNLSAYCLILLSTIAFFRELLSR